MKSAPKVSVIIPTCKRPELLKRCLAALAAQELDPALYEVVVVDDGNDAATRDAVRGTALKARYVPAGRKGPAAARNTGWRAAHGEIIAFTDDDCIPARRWLAGGLAVFSRGVAGAAGRVVVPVPGRPTDFEYVTSLLERSEFVTANCFYRKDALEAVGGFDERFTSAWREDADIFFTMLERGLRLVTAPDAVVVHPARKAPWGVSVREQKKSIFNALLYKKHPRLYRERIQSAPPWKYYGAVGAFVIGTAGVLLGARRRALPFFAAWLLTSAHFCARRLAGTSRDPAHVAEMAATSIVIPFLSVAWRLAGAVKYRVSFM